MYGRRGGSNRSTTTLSWLYSGIQLRFTEGGVAEGNWIRGWYSNYVAIPFRGRDRRIGHELVDDTTNSTPTYSQTRRRGWRGRNSAIGIDEGRRNCLSFPLHPKHTRHPVGPSRGGGAIYRILWHQRTRPLPLGIPPTQVAPHVDSQLALQPLLGASAEGYRHHFSLKTAGWEASVKLIGHSGSMEKSDYKLHHYCEMIEFWKVDCRAKFKGENNRTRENKRIEELLLCGFQGNFVFVQRYASVLFNQVHRSFSHKGSIIRPLEHTFPTVFQKTIKKREKKRKEELRETRVLRRVLFAFTIQLYICGAQPVDSKKWKNANSGRERERKRREREREREREGEREREREMSNSTVHNMSGREVEFDKNGGFLVI